MYSTTLERGQHIIHELSPRRSAWLHLVHGSADFGTVTLNAGDGAGFSAERALSLTARKETEVLLLDLGPTSGQLDGQTQTDRSVITLPPGQPN